MSSLVLVGAVAQAALAVIVGWAFGDLFLHLLFCRRPGRRSIDWHADLPPGVGLPERAMCALLGFVLFAIALMLLHVAFFGVVFGYPLPVPVAASALLFFGGRKLASPRLGRRWLPVVAAAALILALFVGPAVIGGSSIRTGDDPWHLGWTEQLLHGSRVPVGPAPVDANAYPWGFHAVMATLTRLVPGSDPTSALEALQILIALSIPLAAACIARRVDPRAGWGATAAAAAIGGFGWIVAGRPTFLTSPRHPLYGADLVVASPNGVYELFPPPLPRELALALMGALVVLVMIASARGDRRAHLGASLALAAIGLVSVPMLVSGVVWVASVLLASGHRRLGARMMWSFLPAAAAVACWAVPVAINYFRFGGFVNITAHLGYEWSLGTAFASWGLLLPLALAGVALMVRARPPGARSFFALLIGALLLLSLSLARSEFDWNLGGNATLLHQGRVWPPLHLLAAAAAGIALARLWGFVEPRRRAAGAVASVALLGIGVISPAFASIALTRIIHDRSSGFIFGAQDFASGSFVHRAAARLGPDDVVAVEGVHDDPGADLLAFSLFALSGTRLGDYSNPKLPDNPLRIRYRDLAERWRKQRDHPPAGVRVVRCDPRCPSSNVTGTFDGEKWAVVGPVELLDRGG